jgi:DNA-binding CsgD family transcriptional regulator
MIANNEWIALTEKRKTIVQLIADGLSDSEIAFAIGSSERCVRFHINEIFVKLGVHNRVRLAVWYVRQSGYMKRWTSVRHHDCPRNRPHKDRVFYRVRWPECREVESTQKL